jgi:lactocepin
MKKSWKRLLSLVLALSMLIALAVPASAVGSTESENAIAFEKVDNDLVSDPALNLEAADETDATTETVYEDTDVVRVSIVLEDPSTIEAGFATEGIAENTAAVAYRNGLEVKQENLTNEIESTIDEDLDVVWNLTLAANIISANVSYGQIDEIAAMDGVAEVVVENRYDPAVVDSDEADDPNMSTSPVMIGSNTAYAEGYTGAGSRIAIIDTGTDLDHQSFDAGAFDYSLAQLAEEAGEDTDTYIDSLNLLDADEIAKVADQLNAKIDVSKVYLTTKLPYAYNYVDENYVVDHDHDSQGEHGSHVAGIATANAYIPDGEGGYVSALDSVLVQGVAPDAQLITMKVFGASGGAYDSDYMVAIEDAIILGCDVINLSLGSSAAGFSTSADTVYQSIMESLSETDTVVSISAGNNSYWAENANPIGYLYDDGINYATDGSPGSFTNALTVASADNTGTTGNFVSVDGQNIFYTETTSTDYHNSAMTTIAGEHKYVFVDGIGSEAQFNAVADQLAGAIAICYRGTTSFYVKANAAIAAGAIGVIIVNNTSGTISMNLSGYNGPAPCVSITQADGELLKAAGTATEVNGTTYYTGTMTVGSTVGSVSGTTDSVVSMSSFSSWGVPSSLELKPEITAPGGNIYSVNGAVAGGTAYENMSGTSMAAPQITGMSALVAQYIKDNDLSTKTGLTVRALTQSLLMSTAVPLVDSNSGNYYPVFQQGSGLANVGDAVTADSYILMGADATDSYADGKVKAELGDDPDKDGVYSFSFTINNLTDEEEYYDLSADLFTQDLFTYYKYSAAGKVDGTTNYLDTWTTSLVFGATWTVDGVVLENSTDLNGLDFNGDGKVNVEDAQALLDYATGARETLENIDAADLNQDGEINSYDAYLFLETLNTGYAVVPANGSVEVRVTLSLSADQKAELDENYPVGAYVEGYVYASELSTSEGVEGTTHSIPVLGFYGNWTDASMFDVGTYTEYASTESGRYAYLGKAYANNVVVKYNSLGGNYYFGGNPLFTEEYDATRNALSTANGDSIASAGFALIRNAYAVKTTLTNTTTGEVEYSYTANRLNAAYYYSSGSAWYSTSRTLSINAAPAGDEGDTYELTVTAAPEYYVDDEGNVDWDSLGDGASLSIPFTIDNTAPELLSITSHAVGTGFEVGKNFDVTVNDNQYIAGALLYTTDGTLAKSYQGGKSEAGEDWTFEMDTTDLDDGVYLLQVYDYALNCSTYRLFIGITATTKVETISISPEDLTLVVGTTGKLTATLTPDTLADVSVTWSSSDESIATVNENGVVTGVDAGTATITATSVLDPEKSASVTVTVKTIDVTLYGALQDASGQPLLYTWDMSTDKTWSSYAQLDNDIASIAWNWLDDDAPLYQQDSSGYLYTVDVDTGETLTSSADTNAFGAPVSDMDFTFYYNQNHPDDQKLFAVCEYYLLYSSVGENGFGYGWNLSSYLKYYTGATSFVAVTWGGIDSSKNDCLYALDNAGYIWILSYSGGSSIDLSYIKTDLVSKYGLSFPQYKNLQYCSLVTGDNADTLYLSYFTDSTNQFYELDYSTSASSYVSMLIGDVGSDVWPAALFLASSNSGASASADTAISSSVEAGITEVATLEAEDLTDQLSDIVEEDTPLADGSLNSTADCGAEDEEGNEIKNGITVTVTAKDATGTDADSTNGVITVSYDADALTVQQVITTSAVDLTSVNVEDGTITIGYVSLDGIAAGETVATVIFLHDDDYTSQTFTVTQKEIGSEQSGYSEVLTCKHSFEGVVTTEPTCTETGVKTYTCKYCGTSYTEEIPATGHTVVVDEAKDPTSTETGLTEGKHCSVCQTVLVAQEVIPTIPSTSTTVVISSTTQEKTSPQTGDNSKIGYALGLLLLSGTALAAGVVLSARRKKH